MKYVLIPVVMIRRIRIVQWMVFFCSQLDHYIFASHMCQGRSIPYVGDGRPSHLLINRNPYNGYIMNPLLLGWFSHPLSDGKWWELIDLTTSYILVPVLKVGGKMGVPEIDTRSRCAGGNKKKRQNKTLKSLQWSYNEYIIYIPLQTWVDEFIPL